MAEPRQKPGKSKQDYGTPRDFLAAVRERFGPIEADLAASPQNAVAENYYYDDKGGGSFRYSWAKDHPRGNLWLNPPFGDIAPWAEKCKLESMRREGLILMLTPASIGSNWYADHVHGNALILGLSPRLTFVGTSDPYPKDLMLSVFGQRVEVGLSCWRWKSREVIDIDAMTSASERTLPLPFNTIPAT